MTEITIVKWYDANTVLWKGTAEDIRDAVQQAVKAGANLRGADLGGADLGDADLGGANLRGADLGGADLRDANLRGANLRDANLRGANLRGAMDLRLPTGETWDEYLTETVPALLTAGGKPLESFAAHWQCHDWNNCPMAHAFDTHDVSGVPLLLRPRAEQFIQFFDAGQIPWPLPTKGDPSREASR